MILEADVHTAICAFIKEKNNKPDKIIAGYEAAMDMMAFSGSISHIEGTSIMTPFGLLPIEFSHTSDIKEWWVE